MEEGFQRYTEEHKKRGTGFPTRFTIALFVFFCYLLLKCFPSLFPMDAEKNIYEAITDNEWYTNLQKCVMMIENEK